MQPNADNLPGRRAPERTPYVPRPAIRGTLVGELASGGTATLAVTEWRGSGSGWVATGRTETVREIMGISEAIPAGTVCVALPVAAAGYCVIATACDE